MDRLPPVLSCVAGARQYNKLEYQLLRGLCAQPLVVVVRLLQDIGILSSSCFPDTISDYSTWSKRAVSQFETPVTANVVGAVCLSLI